MFANSKAMMMAMCMFSMRMCRYARTANVSCAIN